MTSEDYDKLTDEEKRIKVAECLKLDVKHVQEEGCLRLVYKGSKGFYSNLPDYLNDLNVMHEAVMSLTELDRARFWLCVGKVILGGFVDRSVCQAHFEEIAEATAAQQAKAFVLTMTSNKKEEE
jgi:hypothetical protein